MVRGFHSSRLRFDHPSVGPLTLDTVKLIAAEDAQQNLAVFLPADSDPREQLSRL
jgi:MmyB-like transcription regulator ligand binding domain